MSSGERGTLRPRTVLVAVVAGLAVLAGAGWAWAAWSASSDEESLDRVVRTFEVPQSWEKTVDETEPARVICLGGNACPSSRQEWRTPEALTPDDMAGLVQGAGWDLDVTGDCQPKSDIADMVGVCEATGVVDGFDVWLLQERSSQEPGAQVVLFVDPA